VPGGLTLGALPSDHSPGLAARHKAHRRAPKPSHRILVAARINGERRRRRSRPLQQCLHSARSRAWHSGTPPQITRHGTRPDLLTPSAVRAPGTQAPAAHPPRGRLQQGPGRALPAPPRAPPARLPGRRRSAPGAGQAARALTGRSAPCPAPHGSASVPAQPGRGARAEPWHGSRRAAGGRRRASPGPRQTSLQTTACQDRGVATSDGPNARKGINS